MKRVAIGIVLACLAASGAGAASWSADAKGYIAELSRRPGAVAPTEIELFWWRAEPLVYLGILAAAGITIVILANRHRAVISRTVSKWLVRPLSRKAARSGGRLRAWWLEG